MNRIMPLLIVALIIALFTGVAGVPEDIFNPPIRDTSDNDTFSLHFKNTSRSVVSQSSNTIYVPDNYEKIQWAVDNASAGSTIIVRDGTYAENVYVNVPHLSIMSESGLTSCIVRAAKSSGYVFLITADNVTISGFTVTGATGINYAGIALYAKNGVIANNNISSNDEGIRLGWDSCNNEISGNSISSNNDGIVLFYSCRNTLKNNVMEGNKYNIKIYAYHLEQFMQNMDTSNNINGKPIYYWVNKSDMNVPGDAGFVGLVNCKNISVKDLTINNNGEGVLLGYTNDSKIENVNVSNNGRGIDLWFSSDNEISGNNISNNYVGIFLDYSSDNEISGNNISSNNEYGIDLWFSGDNIIYLNNIIDSSESVHSSSSHNIWNSTFPIKYTYKRKTYENYLGNYRDDYKEKYPDAGEIDGYGIWDTPYDIDSDKDNYPLIDPFENYFVATKNVFDTRQPSNPYPSISGTHNGTILLNQQITMQKLYTYPCAGTGGHSEYARLWNDTWSGKEAYWDGYEGDWHNITFDESFTLFAEREYYYEIRTGSYPQIHHTAALQTANGWINCTKFTDANGNEYDDWIPAIKFVW